MSTATVPVSLAAGSNTRASRAHTRLKPVNQPVNRVDARELNDAGHEVQTDEHEQMVAIPHGDEPARGHRGEDEQREKSGKSGLHGVLEVDVVQVVLGDIDA